MKKIGIVGTGVMGTDIAFLAVISGYEVFLYDKNGDRSSSAFQRICDRTERYAREGKIEEGMITDCRERLSIWDSMNDLCDVDVAIECVSEDLEVKKQVFRDLDAICNAGTILASNTSSISITEIAAATSRPESVIGIHFLIPAHVMKLVELIPGFSTTRETVEMAKYVVKKMKKDHVESRDYPGFMLNRMLIPMINEAMYLLYEGAGTAESIDKVMKTGLNQPLGPLALADMIGLDVVLAVAEEMYRGYSDAKYRPCPLLRKYVAAGFLGKKTGRGFYIYN